MTEMLISWGLNPEILITAMAALAAFLTVFAVWNAAIVRDPMQGRLKALEARREALKAGYIAPTRRQSLVKQSRHVGVMRQVVNKFNLLRSKQASQVTNKLAQAGWRSRDAIVIYLFFKLVLPILVGLTAVVLLYGFYVTELGDMMRIGVALGSILVAGLGPDIFVKNMIVRRQAEIRKAMPDTLDLMVICAEAGLTLDAALMRVSREVGQSVPEMGDELSLTSIELGFLSDRKQALANLSRRVGIPSMRAVVTTLTQTERYGTPLAQSLRVLAAEFRNERMMRAEEKAARLPALLTLPLIVCILPTLFIVLLGPAVLQVMDQFINM